MEELSTEILENLKKLKVKESKNDNHFLANSAKRLGYESLGYKVTYEDKQEGLLIKMPKDHDKYNNGIYILRKLDVNVNDKNETGLVLEVVVPNTKSKGTLITNLTNQISTFLDGLDTSDLTTYDYAEIVGYVVNNWVTKPLAKVLFPDDPLKQERFLMLYPARFLAHSAMINAGRDGIYEEAVNSQPFVLKQMIDNETDHKTDTQTKKENEKLGNKILDQLQKAQDTSNNHVPDNNSETKEVKDKK